MTEHMRAGKPMRQEVGGARLPSDGGFSIHVPVDRSLQP